MNELVTDLKSLELETLKNLKNYKATNTLRAYQADFKDFSLFSKIILKFKSKLSSSRIWYNSVNLYIIKF